jgi:hypothetical protein
VLRGPVGTPPGRWPPYAVNRTAARNPGLEEAAIVRPDAIIHTTDMKSYLALLRHQTSPEEALSKGLVRREGDAGALGRFLDLFRLPGNLVEVDVRS